MIIFSIIDFNCLNQVKHYNKISYYLMIFFFLQQVGKRSLNSCSLALFHWRSVLSLNYKILSIITLFIYLYNLIVIRVEKEDLNPIFHNKQEYYANELQEFWLGVVVVAFLFLFIFMWKQTHIGKRE